MKVWQKCLGATAIAAIAYSLLGANPVRAATFAFSLDMGTADPSDVNYGLGRHPFSGTFSGEDKNGDGWLGLNELSNFEASWENFKFDFSEATGFWASNLKSDSVVVRWIEFARGPLRLDYKRFGALYQQFRVYNCPPNFECEKAGSIDYPIADGLISGDILIGFENIFNVGIPAYLASADPDSDPDPDPDPDSDPNQSVPEPSLFGGLLVLTFLGLGKRRRNPID